jgi:hypothetical protein
VRVKLTADELRDQLENDPRPDYEFDKTVFFSCDDALRELRSPSLANHPTSRYRILMSLFSTRGVDWIKRRLADFDAGRP